MYWVFGYFNSICFIFKEFQNIIIKQVRTCSNSDEFHFHFNLLNIKNMFKNVVLKLIVYCK